MSCNNTCLMWSLTHTWTQDLKHLEAGCGTSLSMSPVSLGVSGPALRTWHSWLRVRHELFETSGTEAAQEAS